MSLLKDPNFMRSLETVLKDPDETLNLLIDLESDGLKFDRRFREYSHAEQVKIIRQLIEDFADLPLLN